MYTVPSHGVRLIALIPKNPISNIGDEHQIKQMRIFPQPADEMMYCSFHSPLQGIGTLEFLTLDGRSIGNSIQLEIRQGMQAFSLAIPQDMPSGLHIMKISTPFSSILHPIHIVH
jgi:hypothetical protein